MKTWSFRRRAVTAVSAVFLLGMGGCIAGIADRPEEIERTRIAGTWTGDDAARVELHPDGRFEMSGIPRSAVVFSFSDPPPGDGKLSGSGRWQPAHAGDTVDRIILYVEVGGSFADVQVEELGVAESGEDPVLYFSTSPDEWYGFEIRKTHM
ncbi:hypothetical protein [Streptomyces sp. NPDC056191]|uniref:hypothetical protein n=1 Tax=Streptomyces sp. NPDC056191 TaxID=3345742 RepID=UPI0035DA4884